MTNAVYAKKFAAFLTKKEMTLRELAEAIDVPAQLLMGMCNTGQAPQQYVLDRLRNFTGESWEFTESAESGADEVPAEDFALDKEESEGFSLEEHVLSQAECLIMWLKIGLEQCGSYSALAQRLQCSVASLYNWMNGKLPSAFSLRRLAAAYCVEPEELLSPPKKAIDLFPLRKEKKTMPNPDEAGAADENPAAAGSPDLEKAENLQEISLQGSSESEDDGKKKKGRRMSTALGELFWLEIQKMGLTLEEFAEKYHWGENGISGLKSVINGYYYPKKNQQKIICTVLGIEPNTMRILHCLPSSYLRGLEEFKRTAAMVGLCLVGEEQKPDDVQTVEPLPSPVEVEKPAEDAEAPKAETTDKEECEEDDEPPEGTPGSPGIYLIKANGGVLQDCLSRGDCWIFNLLTKEYEPDFAPEDALCILKGERIVTPANLEGDGWYMADICGSPVLLRVESDIRRRYLYVSKGPTKPRDKATQLRILGRVVAKVSASYV